MSLFKKQPKKLGDILLSALKSFPHQEKLKQGMVMANWPDIVGRTIAEKTINLRFEGNKLFIKMASSIWRQEVHIQRYTIQNKLNESVNAKVVSEIIVKE